MTSHTPSSALVTTCTYNCPPALYGASLAVQQNIEAAQQFTDTAATLRVKLVLETLITFCIKAMNALAAKMLQKFLLRSMKPKLLNPQHVGAALGESVASERSMPSGKSAAPGKLTVSMQKAASAKSVASAQILESAVLSDAPCAVDPERHDVAETGDWV